MAFCLLGITFTMGHIRGIQQEMIPTERMPEGARQLKAKQCNILNEEEKLLGGGRLTMLANQTDSQMMSFLIETPEGKLIVIDGGTDGDAAYLQQKILEKGGRVHAWLITHPHYDHVGALHNILSQPQIPVTIEHIYYSFADLQWYYDVGDSQVDLPGVLLNDFKRLPASSVHGDIMKGQEIMVGSAKITVLNNLYRLAEKPVNNSSIAYTVEINGTKMMFLGDLGERGGERLLKDVGEENISCDIVQMSHHGQRGVSERFYRILRPKICLWPTPQWLWDNDDGGGKGTGPWLTATTREWMEKLEIERHYCMKDGDQVIE